ncbi:hypothetical protein [Bacillus infantis]|uniref:Uncharacterized protein n=1 Tax=Bacillus infantis TaxID=324767 RepID=A0A5D4RB75_9BACI|nr:hypothetical protein [Bacillus infantis]TYS47018.1 hypothetical protein FZD51_16290 [Bacillus infantis]
MEKRKRLFKAFAASTALSSMILGGAQLASPTYAQFNSTQEKEIQIGACFIFPKVIEEDYRDLAVNLSEEVIAEAKAAMIAGEQLKEKNTAISELNSLNDNKLDDSETNSDNTDAGGGTAVNQLTFQKNSLVSQLNSVKSQLRAVNSGVQEMENKSKALAAYSQSIKSYLESVLKESKTNGSLKLVEIENLLAEINGFKDKAINDCKYEKVYFSEVLTPMNQATEGLKEVLKKLEDEEVSFISLLDESEKNLQSYTDSLQRYRTESARLENEIASIKSNIEKVKGQIEAEAAAKAKAKAEKEKNNQSPPAEKPDNTGKPANQESAKPEESKEVPPADEEKAAPPAGEQKDNASDKPADNGKAPDNQQDAGADPDTGSAQGNNSTAEDAS